MTFLPVLRRELAVAARRTATYRQRVVFAGLATAAIAVLLLSLRSTRFTASEVFYITAWGGFVLSTFEGLRATADSISLERREGTLGLLLLTDLTGREIVIGKVAAASVQSLMTVVAVLPAFALPLLAGGVSGGECWRLMFCFVAAAFFALTAGVLISSVVTGALTAFLGTLFLILALTALPMILVSFSRLNTPSIWFWIGGPVEMIFRVPDVSFAARPSSFWLAALVSLVSSLLMFGAASVLLRRSPRLETTKAETTWWQRWLRPKPGFATAWGAESAQEKPAVWLAERTLPGQRVLWTLVGTGVVLCFLVGIFGGRRAPAILLGVEMFFAYLLKLWLAAVAPQSFNASRRSGALELLLCTPLSPPELVRGQVDVLYAYFVGPALVMVAGFPIFGIGGMALGNSMGALGADSSPLVLGIFWLILFILDFHAIAYAGLWFGLTNARVDRAIAKTIFGVLVMPWISMVIPFIGCLGVIGWPVFWISWASRRLNEKFRGEVTTLFSAEDEHYGWLPWSRRKG